jgi:hypothetical protein
MATQRSAVYAVKGPNSSSTHVVTTLYASLVALGFGPT